MHTEKKWSNADRRSYSAAIHFIPEKSAVGPELRRMLSEMMEKWVFAPSLPFTNRESLNRMFREYEGAHNGPYYR